MVLHMFPAHESTLKLTQDDISDILSLWESFLKQKKEKFDGFQIRAVVRHLLESMNEEGVYLGTLGCISKATGSSQYVLRKNLDTLMKHKLLFRRYGIIAINTKVFTSVDLQKYRKEFFS